MLGPKSETHPQVEPSLIMKEAVDACTSSSYKATKRPTPGFYGIGEDHTEQAFFPSLIYLITNTGIGASRRTA